METQDVGSFSACVCQPDKHGFIGLIFKEIVNEKRLTTNGPDQEQSFHEDNFMPLLEREEPAETEAVTAA